MLNSGHSADVVKDQTVGRQMIILNPLPLFGAVIFRTDAFAAEPDPLRELIEPIAFIHRHLDDPAQIDIIQIA